MMQMQQWQTINFYSRASFELKARALGGLFENVNVFLRAYGIK